METFVDARSHGRFEAARVGRVHAGPPPREDPSGGNVEALFFSGSLVGERWFPTWPTRSCWFFVGFFVGFVLNFGLCGFLGVLCF